ncbi:MAG: asparagine synthase (glutamine-hydrolyzing), partial [Anaerolineales bacterium]
MCGITGFWQKEPGNSSDLLSLIGPMTDQLAHRGPDDEGQWVEAESGLALGFRRLAIIDLTPLGHQPMVSASGRYVMIFNGEVYNFKRLRMELETRGRSFRGGSDTEVMLAAIEEWGLKKAVEQFIGQFAIALWDTDHKRLHLVRDRLGIKPLYYGWLGDSFLFGSELKALKQHPAFVAQVDREALTLYLRYNYIPAPYSIYKNVWKLAPGTIATISSPQRESLAEQAYWSASSIAEHGAANPFEGTSEEAAEELEALLLDSIELRMISDVPLGAFLSGGVDSSTVVALMQASSTLPIKTFTIGFREDEYDEATHAKQVSAHLGTDHTELYVTPHEARSVIPRLPELYDEPFADSSQIPTFLVSQLARHQVTVSLSGDGGDELFGGYDRYAFIA